MLFTDGESISNRAEPDEPEMWRDADGEIVPIPTEPEKSTYNLGVLFVMSHLTGIEVEFRPIRESHPLFDEDQWDGEQMIYEPVQANLCPNVKTLVVYNS